MLVNNNVMSKAQAVLFVHDVEDAEAVVDKLKGRFPSVDSDKIVMEVRLAPLGSQHHGACFFFTTGCDYIMN